MLFQKSTIGFQFNQFVGTQLSRVYSFIRLFVYAFIKFLIKIMKLHGFF